MVFIVITIAISHGVNGHLETDSLILSLLYSIFSRECYWACVCVHVPVCVGSWMSEPLIVCHCLCLPPVHPILKELCSGND